MAQQVILDFVADVVGALELLDPVVEFGSLQVEEGQPNDLRPLFAGREFIGTDMRPGPGVDRVADLRGLDFGDREIGTALCLDTLEHCEDPLAACREMHRTLAEDGVCVISSVMLFGIHGYPNDYWRFTPEGFRTLLDPFDDVWVGSVGDPDIPFQVVGIGAKSRRLGIELDTFPSLARAQKRWERAEGEVRIGPLRMSLEDLGGMLARELPRAVRERVRSRLRKRS
jgi:SAM-dependent methyltransferase